MSATVTHAPNRYHRVQMNSASLNYAPTKGCAGALAAAPYLILSYLCRRTERGKWASRDTGPMSLGRYLIDA